MTALLAIVPLVWPMYQYAPDRNAVFSDASPAYVWHRDSGGKINGGLALSTTALYVETFEPAVVALDRRSGRRLWRAPMRNRVMTTPIVADGLVVVGTGRDRVGTNNGPHVVWSQPGGDDVVALDARTGAQRWRYHTIGEDMPSPALVHVGNRDAIVFANGDDHVRALDMRSGRLLWSTRLAGVSTMASAAVAGGIAFVLAGGSAESHVPDHVYAVRQTDGSIVWSAPYGNADASPVVWNGLVFVEDAQTVAAPRDRNAYNDVFALDARSGRIRWSYESGPGYFTSVGTNEEAIAGTYADGTFFVSLPAARRFAAFDAVTGRMLWSTPTKAAIKMSAVVRGGNVYAGDTAGTFYAFSERDGTIASRRSFARPFTCSPPVIAGSTLYVANGPVVYALPLASL